MARGFDSKSIESQQADAEDRRPREPKTEDPAVAGKRHRLELARVDVENRIRQAAPGPYQDMLKASLRAIEEELRGTGR